MKILLCTNSFENVTNGPAKFANLILEINKLFKNHEIHILTEDISVKKDNVHKVDLKIPNFLYVFSQIFRMFIYHNHILKIENDLKIKFDVIIYNNSFIGLWSAIMLKNTIGMINDDNNISVKLLDVIKNKKLLKHYIFKHLEFLSFKYHKLILCNSNYLLNYLIDLKPKYKNKYVLFYKAIDITNNNFLKNWNEKIKILFVKNDYKRGGLFLLIDALEEIKFDFELIIIGPPENEHQTIKKYINNRISNYEILGPQSQQNIFKILTESHIFCVPSFKEALGVANIEAMNYDNVVISTNTGGIPEVLDYGNNGWLISVGDTNQLKSSIEECYYDIGKRNTRLKNAKKFLNKFDKNNLFKNLLTICEQF